jgi:tRNA/rRNA methyltransferase
MNLGQAVAVCLYELAAHTSEPEKQKVEARPAAPSGDLDLLATVIEESMLVAGYSPRSMQAANRHDLRLLLRRLAPTKRDARRILGLFRRILWRMKRGAGEAPDK